MQDKVDTIIPFGRNMRICEHCSVSKSKLEEENL